MKNQVKLHSKDDMKRALEMSKESFSNALGFSVFLVVKNRNHIISEVCIFIFISLFS